VVEKSKDELVSDAEAIGVPTDGLTKPELVDEIAKRTPFALGPPVNGDGFEQVGSITGVQPMTAEEIPESGR
jgi:hypothetical protein